MWLPAWSYKKKCGCCDICKTHHGSENRFEPSSRIACHTVLPESNMDLTHVLAKQISRDTSTSCAHLHCVLLWAKYHWMRKRGSSVPQKINTWIHGKLSTWARFGLLIQSVCISTSEEEFECPLLNSPCDVAKFFLSWNFLSCKRMLLSHSVVFVSTSFLKSSFALGVMKFLRVNNVCQLVFCTPGYDLGNYEIFLYLSSSVMETNILF